MSYTTMCMKIDEAAKEWGEYVRQAHLSLNAIAHRIYCEIEDINTAAFALEKQIGDTDEVKTMIDRLNSKKQRLLNHPYHMTDKELARIARSIDNAQIRLDYLCKKNPEAVKDMKDRKILKKFFEAEPSERMEQLRKYFRQWAGEKADVLDNLLDGCKSSAELTVEQFFDLKDDLRIAKATGDRTHEVICEFLIDQAKRWNGEIVGFLCDYDKFVSAMQTEEKH